MEADFTPAPFASADSQPVEGAAEWMVALFTGSLAIGLSVLAMAVIGLMMLSGRLPLRAGLQVVLGCFVLLGAPVIASAFVAAGQGVAQEVGEPVARRQLSDPLQDLPPSAFDPYAGASLRQD
jgi:type IV secretory pathway VirB2 component (pilin)